MRPLCWAALLWLLPAAGQAASTLPRPYLALFTFQNSHVDQLSDEQLRLLEASPYDGMAVWCVDGYSPAAPPDLEKLRPRLEHLRGLTRKHLWPFVFLNRILQQEGGQHHTSMKADPAFSRIRGMDLDNETGALDVFLLTWRRSLQTAKVLGSPGVGLDPEFYNDYSLESVAALAQRRGEGVAQTQRKLRQVSRRMADVVREEYPRAAIWSLFTRLAGSHETVVGRPDTPLAPTAAPGCVIQGLLDRAKEARVPLTLVEGSEAGIGYLNQSLDDLKRKILIQAREYRTWQRRYPQLLLGGTIAPWLDTSHRAYWMKDKPVVGTVEEFEPFFTALMQQLPFVWVYGAGNAYQVWEKPYADRFHPVLAAAKEKARAQPAPRLEVAGRYRVPTGSAPRHVTAATGDVLADLSKPAAEAGIRLAEHNAPDGVLRVELAPEAHAVAGGRFVAVFTVSPWPGGEAWQWPGMSIPLGARTDWRGFSGLAVEVHNPDDADAELGISMVDAQGAEWYRYYMVPAGKGGVVYLPTEELQSTVDIAAMRSLSILMRRPPRKTRFWLRPVVLVK